MWLTCWPQHSIQNVLLQTVGVVWLEYFQRRKESLNADLSDRLGIQEAGHILQISRVVLLNQSEQILLFLLQSFHLFTELVNGQIDRDRKLSLLQSQIRSFGPGSRSKSRWCRNLDLRQLLIWTRGKKTLLLDLLPGYIEFFVTLNFGLAHVRQPLLLRTTQCCILILLQSLKFLNLPFLHMAWTGGPFVWFDVQQDSSKEKSVVEQSDSLFFIELAISCPKIEPLTSKKLRSPDHFL